MKAQTIKQIELFFEAELESLEFVPEELEAIEQERIPDLESISFEDIAENLEAASPSYTNTKSKKPIKASKRRLLPYTKRVVEAAFRRFHQPKWRSVDARYEKDPLRIKIMTTMSKTIEMLLNLEQQGQHKTPAYSKLHHILFQMLTTEDRYAQQFPKRAGKMCW